MVISGVAEIALLQDLPEDVKSKLQKIPEQVDRMSSYLERFKAMAYKNKEDFKVFDLDEKLCDFLETVDLIKPKNITIASEFGRQKMKAHGDPYQINQIYLNFAKNAFDAMGDEIKTLTVSSNCVKRSQLLEDPDLQFMASSQEEDSWQKILQEYEEFALVEFKDEGSGVPEELVPNIYDAFFTTKERGKGTGLGLSISSDIAQKHNANLAVKSELSVGTSMYMIIPIEISE
jgi:signal transduction histidine kinase